MMKINTRNLITAAVVGALYAVLTMVLAPISYGALQFRVSEVLCILPFLSENLKSVALVPTRFSAHNLASRP